MDPTRPALHYFRPAREKVNSPTRNVLTLPKAGAWFRLAAQILETRFRADGLAPAPAPRSISSL